MLDDFMRIKSLKTLALGFPLIILFIWFFIKQFQFQSPDQSFVDALIALQISKGWIDGRPFMFESYNGFHSTFHNYYIMLPMGLVTWFTGVYGLFIIYLGLLAFLLIKLGRWITKLSDQNWFSTWLAILIYMIGPFAFLIFIDRFGWHPEQYFLPLLTLSAYYLSRRKWILSITFLVLTASVKETSSALICGLLIFASTTDKLLENPEIIWYKALLQRRNIIIVACCLALFIMSMALLSYMNGSQPSRLSQAFGSLMNNISSMRFLVYVAETITAATLLFFIAILPFIPWLRITPHGYLLAGILLLFLIALAVIFFIEGLLYYPSFLGNLPYPTRIGSAWAFFFSCYLFLIIRLTEKGIFIKSQFREWSLWSCIFQLVFSFFLISENWTPEIYKQGKGGVVFHFIKNFFGPDPYSDQDWQQLHTLAQQLPKNAEVLAPDKYLSVFHRVYGVGWHHSNLVLRQPALYVYEKALLKTSKEYRFPTKGYTVVPNKNLLILIHSTWKAQKINSPEKNGKNG